MYKSLLFSVLFGACLVISCKKSGTTSPKTTNTSDPAITNIKNVLYAGQGVWQIDTGAFYYYDKNNNLVNSAIITFNNGYWTFSATNTTPSGGLNILYLEALNSPQTAIDIPFSLSVEGNIDYMTTGGNQTGSSIIKYQIQTLNTTKMRLVTADFSSLPTGVDHAINVQVFSKYK